VPASGELTAEVLNTAITLENGKPNSVMQPAGTALVIHQGVDDYKSDPAGNAGSRLACGVIGEDAAATVGHAPARELVGWVEHFVRDTTPPPIVAGSRKLDPAYKQPTTNDALAITLIRGG